MYFIVVKFKTKPEFAEKWIDHTRAFTEATRNEPGNLWFDWSRSVDDPNEFVLARAPPARGRDPHHNSDPHKHARVDRGGGPVETPRIISRQIEGDGWDRMGELQID